MNTGLLRQFCGHVLGALLAVWGAVSIVFVATRMIGDPTVLLLPIGAGPEQLAALSSALGLDQSLLLQYGRFLLSALHGDFGISFIHTRPALELVLERLPTTAALTVTALSIGLVLGLGIGLLGALARPPGVRALAMGLAAMGQATPAFWLGMIFILLFSVHLGWLPTGGNDSLLHILLPAMTLAAAIAASVARLLRSSVLDVLAQDHVRTARAKGLHPMTILFWHVLRNALLPVLTLTGILTGELLGGAIVVETVFAWPGIGRLLIQAIAGRDFPVVQAAVVVIALIWVTLNILVDLGHGVLDPRVRGSHHHSQRSRT